MAVAYSLFCLERVLGHSNYADLIISIQDCKQTLPSCAPNTPEVSREKVSIHRPEDSLQLYSFSLQGLEMCQGKDDIYLLPGWCLLKCPQIAFEDRF